MEHKYVFSCMNVTIKEEHTSIRTLKDDIIEKHLPFLKNEDFYLQHNGKILSIDEEVAALLGEQYGNKSIKVIPRILGGKGGFGSMLRAIGAQIEKTTNRDACRDLSGRRLRDINEEQRLKKWFAKQAEREKEKQEAKKRKLEKLRLVADGPPLPKIEDQEFLQKREDISEAVYEAVDEAFRKGTKDVDALALRKDCSNSSSSAVQNSTSCLESEDDTKPSTSGGGVPDSASSSATVTGKKQESKSFKRTMFDEELDSDSSSEDETESESGPAKKSKMA